MTVEQEPCPLCRSPHTNIARDLSGEPKEVFCKVCGCSASIAAWNRRPSLSEAEERKRSLLTADEVMAEVEEVASEPVKKVLRQAYYGHGRFPLDKGRIAQVVLRDLALEPVTMFRRKVPREEAPIHARRKALAAPSDTGGER